LDLEPGPTLVVVAGSFRLEHPSLVLSIDWRTTENVKVATRVHGFLQLPADSGELACGW
jgi:hypothetical protein